MGSRKEVNKLSDLEKFLKELKEYRDRLENLKESKMILGHWLRERDELAEKLLRKIGMLKGIIIDLTGTQYMRFSANLYDIWSEAFNLAYEPRQLSALNFCINATAEAIGKLKSDIQSSIRDLQGNITAKSEVKTLKPPQAFISHGKDSKALNELERFLRELGIEPLVVKDQPSKDRTLDDKVNDYLNQADCVIILATGDDKVIDKLQPRGNVIHETGLAQKTHKGKIIYLLEEGTDFPSNIRPKVWEPFTQDKFENVFECLVRELKAFGILKAIKPDNKE